MGEPVFGWPFHEYAVWLNDLCRGHGGESTDVIRKDGCETVMSDLGGGTYILRPRLKEDAPVC